MAKRLKMDAREAVLLAAEGAAADLVRLDIKDPALSLAAHVSDPERGGMGADHQGS